VKTEIVSEDMAGVFERTPSSPNLRLTMYNYVNLPSTSFFIMTYESFKLTVFDSN